MKIFIGVVLLLVGAIMTLGIYGYWWQNPDLTVMQLFREVWGSSAIGVLALSLGATLLEASGAAQ